MIQRLSIPMLTFVITFCACAQDKPDRLYRPSSGVKDTAMWVDFARSPLGTFTDQSVKELFGNIQWVSTEGRSDIVDDTQRGRVLRVSFPKGSVGPQQSGIQFLRNLPAHNEYYYDCYLKFDDQFDFRLGGKLPGLTSGGDRYTGGVNPTQGEGWSARYMWTDKLPVVYLYYIDMPDKYGEPLNLKDPFRKGEWIRLTQYVKVNHPNQSNAVLKVWVNGKIVLDKQNFRLRLDEKGMIDSFYFSTFHGGSTVEWAPLRDCYLYIDDLLIKKTAIKF